MSTRHWLSYVLAAALAVSAGLAITGNALACGGFFCQTSPVDQNAERIIFTQNNDGTISAYIQIQYTGLASDFSWILPLPTPIGPGDVEVPEDAMGAFTELEVVTDPVFIPPETPECVRQIHLEAWLSASEDSRVQIFASGEVGPYGFDAIGSEDPQALINWLREHDYRVTEDMEPLINVYVEEGFVFLAMQLLPGQGAQSVEPVKVTYASERPMIPLRLTAVAANPNMAVMVWIYADKQAMPVNYAEIHIPYEDLTFFARGGSSNYRQLMGQRVDDFGGQAFITEYAAPTRKLAVIHPLLKQLRNRYPYVTRLNTVISPEEMTVDPVFDYDPQRRDVSNIHDLSGMEGLYDCESRSPTSFIRLGPSGGIGVDTAATDSPVITLTWTNLGVGAIIGAVAVLLVAGMVTLGVILRRRFGRQDKNGADSS